MTIDTPVTLKGNALAAALLRRLGWRLLFDGLPARQGVLIVYPHTSNWDFPVGLLAKWAIGLHATFWAKHSLFSVPLFGRWMRWVGGRPVDRQGSHGIVDQMARELVAARTSGQFLWLALAPEGTRRRATAWRSGFYQVALQAGVPVGVVAFDYARRELRVNQFLTLSGDRVADLAEIERALGQPVGKRPEGASPIRFNSP